MSGAAIVAIALIGWALHSHNDQEFDFINEIPLGKICEWVALENTELRDDPFFDAEGNGITIRAGDTLAVGNALLVMHEPGFLISRWDMELEVHNFGTIEHMTPNILRNTLVPLSTIEVSTGERLDYLGYLKGNHCLLLIRGEVVKYSVGLGCEFSWESASPDSAEYWIEMLDEYGLVLGWVNVPVDKVF